MITNYLFLNRELLDEVYGVTGSILVITKSRTDAVNFYNELLMKYSSDTSALRNEGRLTIASKDSKIVVRAVRNKEDLNGLQGEAFTRIYAVGFHSDEDFEFFESWLDYSD